MDTISNMIIKIKNAGQAGHERVIVPYSRLNHAIGEALKKGKFVKGVETATQKSQKVLALDLFLEKRVPKIRGVRRISKPSKRIYRAYADLRPVKNGYGALILSTSRGVMSDREARQAKLGGEALFAIW